MTALKLLFQGFNFFRDDDAADYNKHHRSKDE